MIGNKKNIKIICLIISITAIVCMLSLKSNLIRGFMHTDEPIEIVFSHFHGEGDERYDFIQEAVERYEKDHKNVTIIQDYYPTDIYLGLVSGWNEKHKMRDITLVLGNMSAEFAQNGSILELSSYLNFEGETYTLTWNSSDCGYILYNKEIFDSVGIEKFPDTLEELTEAILILKDHGYIPMAVGNELLWPADSLIFSSFVNNFVGNEWYDNILNMTGEAAFTDEAFIHAIIELEKLAIAGMFNEDCNFINSVKSGELYQNREAAMIPAGNWDYENIAKISPEIIEETYVAVWPIDEELCVTSASVVSSTSWGMAVSSQVDQDKIPYIMDFMKNYLYIDDVVEGMLDEDSSNLNTIATFALRENEVLRGTEITTCLNWDSTLPVEVKKVYQTGLQRVLVGEKDARALAKEMQKAYEGILHIKDKKEG